MNVLLLTHNRTVQEMVALAFRGLKDCRLDIAEGMASWHGDGKGYDVMIVDDTLPEFRESPAVAKRLGIEHTVLLAQQGRVSEEGFDHRISKPFLPDEIVTLMEAYAALAVEQGKEKERTRAKKSKKKQSHKRSKSETEVLNFDEIETIKALLEDEGLEIVNEEELAEKVLLDERKEEQTDRQNKALLKALRKMKSKKIRKLLKGAHVRLEITFPKG